MSKKITIPTCMSPFKVTINGEEYIYPAGAEVEVPDEVAHVIECHENTLHKPIEEANSGGASSGGGSPEGGGSSSGGKPNVQEKEVIPTSQAQIIVPDDGYTHLSKVTVKAIPYVETNNAAGGITVTIG